jgi:hypothetical protein
MKAEKIKIEGKVRYCYYNDDEKYFLKNHENIFKQLFKNIDYTNIFNKYNDVISILKIGNCSYINGLYL